MPTYVYRFVDTGETIEVQQAFSDAALTEARHPGSGELMAVKKVFTPVGVTFKGTGFYKTDSRGSSSRTAAPAASSSSSDGGSSSSSSSDGGAAKESTAASASSTTSSSSSD
jgi:predicted nucleic acid-binding Zn ribbon protein